MPTWRKRFQVIYTYDVVDDGVRRRLCILALPRLAIAIGLLIYTATTVY